MADRSAAHRWQRGPRTSTGSTARIGCLGQVMVRRERALSSTSRSGDSHEFRTICRGDPLRRTACGARSQAPVPSEVAPPWPSRWAGIRSELSKVERFFHAFRARALIADNHLIKGCGPEGAFGGGHRCPACHPETCACLKALCFLEGAPKVPTASDCTVLR